jgi:hypothetical protein
MSEDADRAGPYPRPEAGRIHSSVTMGTTSASWTAASRTPGPLIDATTAGRSPTGTPAIPSTSFWLAGVNERVTVDHLTRFDLHEA